MGLHSATMAQGCTHTSTGVSIHTGTFVHLTHLCDDMVLSVTVCGVMVGGGRS